MRSRVSSRWGWMPVWERAHLLWRGEKPASAAFLLETASRLYGPRTANGRKAAADAERIWQQILPSEGSRG